MAKIWRNRIWGGTQTFDACPTRWKDDVLALMRIDVTNGEHTAEEFTKLTGIEY